MRTLTKGQRHFAAVLSFVVALPLAGCSGVLAPVGPIGQAEKVILLDALGIMLAIVVPVIVSTLGFAWWFRSGNDRALYRPDFANSGRIELLVWSIPALTILVLGGIAWIGSHRLDPAQPLDGPASPLEIEVVSLDWKWLFIYRDQHVASVNSLVLPVGVPVHFRLTSASVMNTFFVPRLGSQIYTMNGMTNELNLRADEAGVYRGFSGHFSGNGFSDMHFATRVLPKAEFDGWVEMTQRTDAQTLDRKAYRMLSRQSVVAAPYTYRSVDPGLFDAVVRQALPPGDGPGRELSTGQVSGRKDPEICSASSVGTPSR